MDFETDWRAVVMRPGHRPIGHLATELAAAMRDEANAKATVTGKGQADAELQKFYRDVLPPDQSGARRIIRGKAAFPNRPGC